jgi:hypothetical protein
MSPDSGPVNGVDIGTAIEQERHHIEGTADHGPV